MISNRNTDMTYWIRIKNTPIKQLFQVYLVTLGLFTFYRILLFILSYQRVVPMQEHIYDIIGAFWMGIRFDVVITGYVVLLPSVVWFVFDLISFRHSSVIRGIRVYFSGVFALCFLITTADIPYFMQFFQRFSIGAFDWADHPGFVVSMIIQEPRLLAFIIPFLLSLYLMHRAFKAIFTPVLATNNPTPYPSIIQRMLWYSMSIMLIFMGIRGRITQKSPIRIGTAYFSSHPFLNQLGLNPVFTLMRSGLDALNPDNTFLQLMDGEEAALEVRKQLGITTPLHPSPIARWSSYKPVVSDDQWEGLKETPNVVLIIMESMTAAKLKRHGSTRDFTPFLDSLTYESIYFERCYTAGKHTYNGIFSTLFSFPAIFRQHPMKDMNRYHGLSSALKPYGYQRLFFTTHDGQFDNMEGFLKHNDFDRIYSQKDYPIKEIKTTLGVPDDFMFRFSIPVLERLHQKKQPFLSVYMTSSDHKPYYVPAYYQPRLEAMEEQVVEYADWSLRQFFHMASQQPWFSNTLFVLIADHGAPWGGDYDISLNYHHTPLLYYSPGLGLKPESMQQLCGQIDVYPSVMWLLGLDHINNTLGQNIFQTSSPYVLLNDDDKIGVLGEEYFLIYRKDEPSRLYHHVSGDKQDKSTLMPGIRNEMEIYLKSRLQVLQDMITSGKTGPDAFF
jgi:phosphoglycerol transferase MdoB-like AlkP superfamily enzyme